MCSSDLRREEKQLQEEARRGRYIRGFDLIQAIESAGEWVDWQELNRMMQSNVQNGKMLAFLLQLDYYDASQQDDIQDRMVINNLITMTEDRTAFYTYFNRRNRYHYESTDGKRC